jgi:hypothetical protein
MSWLQYILGLISKRDDSRLRLRNEEADEDEEDEDEDEAEDEEAPSF